MICFLSLIDISPWFLLKLIIHLRLVHSNNFVDKFLTKSLSKELGKRNITVNAIAPGFINSDMTNNLAEANKNEYLNDISLNRFGEAEDVANLVSFLASDNASYITGQIINIDGGIN